MFSYINSSMAVADDMLISYAEKERTALIPGQIEGHPIRRVGNGAISGGQLQRVELQEGIRWAKGAFEDCRSLREVILPASIDAAEVLGTFAQPVITRLWRDMRQSEYDLICAGIPLSGGMRVVTADPKFCESIQAVRSLFRSGCAIASGMTPAHTALFYAGEILPVRGAFYAGGLMQMAFSPEYEGLSEIETVLAMIAKGNMGFADAKEEAAADMFARMDRERAITRTSVIFTHDGVGQTLEDGRVRAQLICRRGYFFFPSLCCVVNDGKKYYVYRRNYMTEGRGYIRMDICVMHADGMETDARVVEKVYGKYKLLSLL